MIELGCAFLLGCVGGGALAWTCKTRIQALAADAKVMLAKLHAVANAVAAARKN